MTIELPKITKCKICTNELTVIGCTSCNTPICIPCLNIQAKGIKKDILKLEAKCPLCEGELEYL